jgi:beta-lactamase superfamily II metal-dependent hydrolase
MEKIKYEIEMLSVGDADAFVIYHSNGVDEKLILIDAGKTAEHGNKIVNLIKNNYPQKTEIDLAINTHLDSDHIGGFEIVLKSYKIKEFWMHDPWAENLLLEAVTFKSTNHILLESLRQSKALLEIIRSTPTTTLVIPYENTTYSSLFKVLGPTKKFYQSLLPKFRNYRDYMLEEKEAFKNDPFQIDKSAENNSSLIILFTPYSNTHYLFTGDAGPIAFHDIWHKLEEIKIYWLDVPHHGSIKNFDKRLLDLKPKIAYVSAIGNIEHPNSIVVKHLKEIGCKVYSSSDGNILHRRGTESRFPYYKKAKEL